MEPSYGERSEVWEKSEELGRECTAVLMRIQRLMVAVYEVGLGDPASAQTLANMCDLRAHEGYIFVLRMDGIIGAARELEEAIAAADDGERVTLE